MTDDESVGFVGSVGSIAPDLVVLVAMPALLVACF
jgi:hypothetical protein